MMAQLVYFKEWLTTLYKRHVEIILPILKLLFAFFALSMFQRMFYYNEFIDKPWVFLAVSAVQAFLPISFLYYAISILIMINLWNVSMDIFLGFVIFFIICSLAFIRVDKKHAIIIIATVLLFYLKLEYLLLSTFRDERWFWSDSSGSGRNCDVLFISIHDRCKYIAYDLYKF